MLTPVTCPHCQGSASLLEVISSICLTDIYQCQACGRVSERPKGVSEGPLPIQTWAAPEPSFLKVAAPPAREGAVIAMSAWRRNV
jgi:hypothetical protein